jgi:hypothetical protein
LVIRQAGLRDAYPFYSIAEVGKAFRFIGISENHKDYIEEKNYFIKTHFL